MKRFQLLASCVLALALCAVAPMGCGSQGGVTVKLTDAPGDFKTAVVTISEVYLQGEGGRFTLSSEPTTTNLLSLANDTADIVKDAVVPAGSYSELRFVISGAYIEVEEADGSTRLYATSSDYAGLPEGAQVAGLLQMPSMAQSGLKVKWEGAVEITGEQQVLLVDFDVAQSFGRQAGLSGQWVMEPVVKGADITFSGSVRVTLQAGEGVRLPVVDGNQVTLGGFKAALINDGGSREEMALTDANGDGVFEAHFKFLIPGAFKVDFTAPAGVSFSTNPGVP
ncbi:MAG TPA: DUF4382 domain-containing protein, partial [Myxococcaceae bacterium]|nr:DUF4382 domain-containing protein [Myxococcaceae bacterium]